MSEPTVSTRTTALPVPISTLPLQRAFTDYLLAAEPQPDMLQTWLPSPTCLQEKQHTALRLQVYRNNVLYSLGNALAAQFPVVAKLVGKDFFTALAREFVLQHPPQEPALTFYGAQFSGFIASHHACRPLPYLADVAQLEYSCQQALHAADDTLPDLQILAALPPEQLAAACFDVQASVTLLESRWPIAQIWTENQHDVPGTITVEDAAQHYLLVYRRELQVQVVALQKVAFALLLQLQRGQPLLTAWRSLQTLHALDEAELPGLLAYLLGLQVFSRIYLPEHA